MLDREGGRNNIQSLAGHQSTVIIVVLMDIVGLNALTENLVDIKWKNTPLPFSGHNTTNRDEVR